MSDATPTSEVGRTSRTSEFNDMWLAYTVTVLGSAVGVGAIPLIAITALDATVAQVSAMAALVAVSSALITVPLAPVIDRIPKRRVLITVEWTSFVAMTSIVVAYALGALTFAHLCAVAVVQSAGSICYLSAATAFIRMTVAAQQRVQANSRMEVTTWTTMTAGPAIGGMLITAFGAVTSVLIDALSFAIGAIFMRRVKGRYDESATPTVNESLGRRTSAGIRHILTHRTLRGLFFNAMLFGGAVTMTAPLLAVFMLRDLHLSAWQYGLTLGAPAAAGLLGSAISPRLVKKFGFRPVLLWSGAARGPWILLLLIATAGTAGLVTTLASQSLLLLTAGIFNPVFATQRMDATPSELMTRVTTAWSVCAKTVQPLCIALGGWLALQMGIRTALLIAGALCLTASLLLPWRTTTENSLPQLAQEPA